MEDGACAALEKQYGYNFEKGLLRCSFISHETLRVKLTVFRELEITEEKQQYLFERKNYCDSHDIKISMEEVRLHLSDEYIDIKESCIEEILLAQECTGGIVVGNSIRTYAIPDGYIRISEDDFCQSTGIDKYPFNFGVRLYLVDDPKKQFYRCLGHDKCRNKFNLIALNLRECSRKQSRLYPQKSYPSDESIVLAHLMQEHWSQLIQLKYIEN